ncbi:MAG: PepSY domain-containing protein [Clostridiales bacterium]|nr:PepSY domain-containing protein [Clostridiales bacterium]MDY4181333.1 PepSY domain-containing protein [Pseudoflavonifractor sp.]
MKYNWKKSVSIVALAALLTVGAAAASSAVRQKITAELRPDITLKVNGEVQELKKGDGKELYAITYNGTTYLPVRAVGEAVGMEVRWDSKSQTVSLTGESRKPAVSEDDGYISREKAEAAALKDAGVKRADVTFEKSKLDRDGDRAVYDIEFYSAEKEYDYEIDALTGEILKREQEPRQTSDASGQSLIGVEKAKKLAAEHAGLTVSQVKFTECELDRDDGRVVYELEFRCGGEEYEYTVDACSGAILEAERD